jgi:hypothetical protein
LRTGEEVVIGLFGFGKSRETILAEFAKKACASRQTISILLKETYLLALALENALAAENGLEPRDTFQESRTGLALACPKCGEYNDQARDAVLLGGAGHADARLKGTEPGGLTLTTLNQGRCPGCHGERVEATFGPEVDDDDGA